MYKKYIYAISLALLMITLSTGCENEVGTKEFPPYFTTKPSYFEGEEVSLLTFDADGLNPEGKKETILKVVTTIPWVAKSNADWLKISHTSGEYNTNIIVTAQVNESASSRSTTIVLTPEVLDPITVTVTQSGM